MRTLDDLQPTVRFRPSGLYLCAVICFLVAANLVIVGLAYRRIPLDQRFAATAVCLNAYLAMLFLLGNRKSQTGLQAWIHEDRRRIWFSLPALLLPFLIYALGTQSFRWIPFLKLLAYVVLPAGLLLTIRRASDRMQWQDVAVMLMLWLPLDFRWMRDVWGWPRNSLAYSMNSLLATCLAVFLFVVVRRVGGVGYHYHFQWNDWRIGLRNFLYFAPIAIPIGLLTGFISVSSRFAPPWQFLLSAVGIFIFIAIPEELLFRGIIQNSLQKTLLKPLPALIVTSIIFGAAHLNNGPTQPDWRYFLLASIAGLFYGNAYTRTGGLLAPAVVHTLVDTVWRTFFR
jgi:membrane protease YdiL (CAAX protease family)